VYCSGNNDKGQLGRDDIDSVTYILPTTSTDNSYVGASFKALASGPDNMLALTTGGELWAWGANSNGELGNGQTADSNQPVRVHNMRNIVKMGCGFGYCAALDATGILYGWGKNDRFQLGGASGEKAVTTPVQILEGVSDFSCGGSHMLAVVDNRLFSWGEGTLGATGHPKNIPSLVLDRWYVRTPTAVADFADVNVRSIAAGGKHSIVLDACGEVYTFGSDSLGQLGLEKLTAKRYQFRSLVAKTNANIKRRGVTPVAVYASWFDSFVNCVETAL
jgi:alpha-tubulin suppressor-like RCC1 family protein